MTTALLPGSSMTEQQFGVVFAKLAIQLRWTDADTAAIQSYYEALKDVSLEAVQASALRFAQEPGRKWFPTTGEWVATAQQVQTEALKRAVKPARDEPWHVECEACQDTGFVQGLVCEGTAACGRPQIHTPHPYVRMCPCRPTNRTFLRHSQFGKGA